MKTELPQQELDDWKTYAEDCKYKRERPSLKGYFMHRKRLKRKLVYHPKGI